MKNPFKRGPRPVVVVDGKEVSGKRTAKWYAKVAAVAAAVEVVARLIQEVVDGIR